MLVGEAEVVCHLLRTAERPCDLGPPAHALLISLYDPPVTELAPFELYRPHRSCNALNHTSANEMTAADLAQTGDGVTVMAKCD